MSLKAFVFSDPWKGVKRSQQAGAGVLVCCGGELVAISRGAFAHEIDHCGFS